MALAALVALVVLIAFFGLLYLSTPMLVAQCFQVKAALEKRAYDKTTDGKISLRLKQIRELQEEREEAQKELPKAESGSTEALVYQQIIESTQREEVVLNQRITELRREKAIQRLQARNAKKREIT